MNKQKNLSQNVWKIMMSLSIIYIAWTLFIMSQGTKILPTAFKLAGSPQSVEDIEKSALDFMNMSMLKPLWEGLWAGFFGLFIAFKLKVKKKYAWTLGVFWGIMMITNAVVQGGYEIIILGWTKICLQTYMYLLIGIVALSSLLITREDFIKK